MPALLQGGPLLLILKIYCVLILLAPVLLRSKFRLRAKLNPQIVPLESLPPDVQSFMTLRAAPITKLGFEPVGTIALSMVQNAGSFMTLYSNPRTSEWADVSVVKSAKQFKGYIEFITRCSDDSQVDTNSSSTAPVLSPTPTYHVFRFPQVTDAPVLYQAHHKLVQQNLRGAARPEIPAKGQELAELKRRLERYGVRQQKQGYLELDASGEFYRLTWKGAILGAWRSLWPVSALRRFLMQSQSQTRLRALGVGQYRSA
jgi:hypothetical protein